MNTNKYVKPEMEIMILNENVAIIATSNYDPDTIMDKDPDGNWYDE